MATKRICDRCGSEINPGESVTYAGFRKNRYDINEKEYELCCSCAMWLKRYLDGEAIVIGQQGVDDGDHWSSNLEG